MLAYYHYNYTYNCIILLMEFPFSDLGILLLLYFGYQL